MAIYYVKNGGSNAASGLSDALAWETIAKVNSVSFSAGDSILFKCGSTWSEILETADDGSVGNVITYGSYSTGANPIITAMGLVPGSKTSGNWTNNGSNNWSISLPPTMFSSDWMFVRFWFNDEEKQAAFDSTVSVSYPWYYDYGSETLYVYSTYNPASAYTSIKTSHLREYAMTCGNEYITITNLDLRGGRTSLLLTGNHILVDSCDIGWDACIVGLWIAPAAGDDLEVDNCTIDTGCTFYYDGDTHASSYEGIILRGDITGLLIHDCYLKNWGHACIGLNNPNAMTVTNVKIYNNYFTSPDIDYGRALNLELPTGSGSGIEVYNNILYNLPTQSQFNLNGLKFYNNIVNTVRATWREKGQEGINMAGYDGSYDPRDIKIWNNVFANCEDAGLGIRQGTSAKTGIEVINNIFYENLGHLDYVGWHVSMMIDDSPEISDNIFKNNLFYRTGYTDIIIYDGVNHTVAQFNAHNGNNGDVITNNLDDDPLFVDAASGDFNLTVDSPARGMGIDVGLTSDSVGTVWGTPPSIGAYEYAAGSGAVYYVKNGGSDAASGLSDALAWETIAQVNASSFNSGDQILFKRGSTWYEALTVPSSGVAGNPIIFGAYGTGADPIISGFWIVNNWVSEGAGIYSRGINWPNIVTIDDVVIPLARFPKTAWLTIDSHVTNTTITDASIDSAVVDWTGAEAVIKKTAWILDRATVTDHTGNTITYTDVTGRDAIDGFGYFFQNHPSALTTLGDWYFLAGTIYMYFGAVDPTTKVVKVGDLSTTVTIDGKEYITFDGLKIEGSINAGIYLHDSHNITLENCTIIHSGKDAIELDGTSNFISISNNVINYTYNNGIQCVFGSILTDIYIGYNTISNTATVAGMGESTDGTYIAIMDAGVTGDRFTIEYNAIINTGFNAINFNGDSTVVRRNYIDNFCLTKDDGSGIYTYTGDPAVEHTMRYVTDNIVLNGIGVGLGTLAGTTFANGIYFDNNTYNVTATGNTIGYIANNGILLNGTHAITLEDNTLYDCSIGITAIGYTDEILSEIIFDNNIIAKLSDVDIIQNETNLINIKNLFWVLNQPHEYYSPGTIDNNFYITPSSDTSFAHVNRDHYNGAALMSFSDWKTFISQSANSEFIIDESSHIHFIYNETEGSKVYTLSAAMVDVSNVSYSGTVTLTPFTSKILLGVGTVTLIGTGVGTMPGTLVITISNQIPYLPGTTGTLEITISNQIGSISVSTSAVTAITNTTATCGGNVTSDGGGTVTARGVCWRMNVVPNIGDSLTTNGTGTGTFTSSLTGLTANRTYYVRAYATNESGTVYGTPVMFQTGNTTVPEPQNVGNLATYRFYVYEAPTSISYEVFPLNFLSTTISYEKDKANVFYRKKFNGTLLFGTNSAVIDYDGTAHNRSEDWDLFWGIENMDPDAILYLDIHKIASGVVTTYWEGFFSTTDGKFDIDRCTFEVTPTVNDEYTPILDNADIQYNILSDSYYTIPIVPCHAYIAGAIDETYTRTRRFYDPAGSNTLEFLAQKVVPGVTVVSSFFSDALDITGETNKMRYLTIAQKSDIIRYDSSTAATSAMISWNEMMDILWAMWQVTWVYNSSIDTIYIEHISYFGHSAGLDLTNELSTQATNKYSYIKEKMPKYEKFNFMEADNHNFVGWPIFYESSQVDQDPDTNVRTTTVPVTTDLEYIIAEHDAIADEGFVILACDASWDVLLDLGAYTSEVRLNMPLSWANLQDRFFRHNRVLITGYMNNQLTTFITAQKTKRQECSTIVCSDFDPENEITTQLGTTYFAGAKALVENATLHPSGELNLSLLYGPADNAATFPAAQKWVLLRQITCDHWHATYSETPTTAPTINMKYTIFESDHVSAHCFDAVGVDWDLSAVDNLTIAFCGGGIPVGGCVRFVNTIPATTWVVTFIYLQTCEC